jgi:hypothetical protein
MKIKNNKRKTVPAEVSVLSNEVKPNAEMITVTTKLAFNKDDKEKL